MYQRVGQAAYKANLDNTLKLSAYLDHPENSFKSVHVAGTNGKGSTSHMLASVLQEAGYTVGLYTSPHLKDFRERIKINGKMIPKRKVSAFVTKHKSFFETNALSFFEMTVGLAFDYFRTKKVDIAVIEVGLGGRLDSTNIILPEISVITNIGLDHTQFLGTTLAEIASEKAGIIKQYIPVVVGETTFETKPIFQRISEEKRAPIFYGEQEIYPLKTSDLKGSYQKMNQRTVLKTLEVLKEKGWEISEKNTSNGLKKVVENTGLLGRWQVLQHHPKIICDTAHNKEGLHYVLQQLQEEPYKNLHIVLGMVSDKAIDKVLPLFPKKACYYFCKPNIERGMGATALQRQAINFELHGEVYASVKNALKTAQKRAVPEDLIFVGGSTFVVAEVV
jgi:dihydrofolate synthase / folylpolyglutamate synthase